MIVLDSHIWFWWIREEYGRTPSEMLVEIDSAPSTGVSAISCFELALAHHRGRLELPVPPKQWFEFALSGSGIELLPITPEISARAVELSAIHRDPFDRIIIATALDMNARLASVDGNFPRYPELAETLIQA